MKNNTRKIINITEKAMQHLLRLSQLNTDKPYLRVSIKQGGCSGMSYAMNFIYKKDLRDEDEIVNYTTFQIVCDSRSLLYLYGTSLDYQDSLIGGGFKFTNPNATQTCGCGKSFTV